MKKCYVLFTIYSVVILLVLIGSSYAKDIGYSRREALRYASEHCGTSENTKYNFLQYKCWNARYPECENYGQKNKKGNYVGVDCANFVSQALIEGGLDFSDYSGATNIGKGDNDGTRGFPGVKKLLASLAKGFCFEIISDPSKAQPGDILASRSSSHVTIYAGNDKYYGERKMGKMGSHLHMSLFS
jgi:hypothetical protein